MIDELFTHPAPPLPHVQCVRPLVRVFFSGGSGLLAVRQDMPGGESVRRGPVGVPDCRGEEPPPASGGAVCVADREVASSV